MEIEFPEKSLSSSLVDQIKEKCSKIIKEMSYFSHGDMNGLVKVMDSSFYKRMITGFPEPIFMELSEKEIMQD